MLRSDLCDYNDAYIAVKGIVNVSATAGANNIRDKKSMPLAFKKIMHHLFLAFQKQMVY